jgi:hypothetical protein
LGESGDTVSVPSGATLDASNATLTLPDDSVTTAKIDDGAVTNAKVDASAAIAYSKLNLATSIVNADISTTAAIATTKLGAGAVLQVVTATDTTYRGTSSSTFVTGSNTLSVSITPSSASNKIFIITNLIGVIDNPNEAHFTIFRDATNIGGSFGIATIFTEPASAQLTSPISMSILDSPNTTSATTYQVYVKAAGGGTVNFSAYPGGGTATITAFEIAG